MTEEKIYCNECKFKDWNDSCSHPKLTKIKNTFKEQKEIHPLCKNINKNNNCKYFEKYIPAKPPIFLFGSIFIGWFGAFFTIEPAMFLSLIMLAFYFLRKMYRASKENDSE